MSMKIEDLSTKFPKKIDGEIVEFMVENPVGHLEEFRELRQHNIRDIVSGTHITREKRYGSIISINKLSHWSLALFTRYAKSLDYSNRSASKMIDLLVEQMRSESTTSIFDEKEQISYEELTKFFNRKFIYKHDDMLTTPRVLEIFIPDLTFHEVSLFREILLALVEPKLIDMEGIIWINESEGEKLDLKLNKFIDYSGNPEKLQHWMREEEFNFLKEFSNLREVAQLPIEIDESDPVKERKIKRMFNKNLSEFKHLKDEDVLLFQERFNKLKSFSKKLGRNL